MPASIKGKIGRTLGAITLLTAMGLSLGGCKEVENPYRNLTGTVYSITQQDLGYIDNGGLSPINLSVPITFLEIESQGETYEFILAGPHSIKQGETLEIVYLVDSEVTGAEIKDRFFGEGSILSPHVRFTVDGYVYSWDKK